MMRMRMRARDVDAWGDGSWTQRAQMIPGGQFHASHGAEPAGPSDGGGVPKNKRTQQGKLNCTTHGSRAAAAQPRAVSPNDYRIMGTAELALLTPRARSTAAGRQLAGADDCMHHVLKVQGSAGVRGSGPARTAADEDERRAAAEGAARARRRGTAASGASIGRRCIFARVTWLASSAPPAASLGRRSAATAGALTCAPSVDH